MMTTLLFTMLQAPGVTAQFWALEEPFEAIPSLATGQAPNAYHVQPSMTLEGPIVSPYGELAAPFYGELKATVEVATSGLYEFRVETGSHADLRVSGEFVTSTTDPVFRRPGGAEGRYQLPRGRTSLRVRLMHNAGRLNLRLLWKPPGARVFAPIPEALLTTEPGQTFVTSAGPKKANLGRPTTPPGDGRPLEAVHPSFTLENFRGPDFTPAVGGMAFLPDGRLAVCTWDERGAVYLISSLANGRPKVSLFADGLGEPLGIRYVPNEGAFKVDRPEKGFLYVTQKGEVTRLIDRNNDGRADRFETVASGWPTSQNYHEFTFNLVPYQGAFYLSSSVPLRSGNTNYMPGTHGSMPISDGPGSWIKVNPQTGAWERLATGLRTPNGMNIGVDGRMFTADNQGSWLPASTLYALQPGAKYLHQEAPEGKPDTSLVSLWFPHGEIGNSPSEMVLVPDGPYRGQMLIGDVTHGGIKRIAMERVRGHYQGAVFRHSQGLEAGVNRLLWGPDGSLYVGGIGSNGNWNHLGHKFGLQRLRPNGKVPFEILEVSARRDGMIVRFTKSVPAESRASIIQAAVRQWRYESTIVYGGPKLDEERLSISSVVWNAWGSEVFLKIDGLKEDRVVYLNLRGLTAGKERMWSPEAWYTMARLPESTIEPFGETRNATPISMPKGAEWLIGPKGEMKLKPLRAGAKLWPQVGNAREVVHDPVADIGGSDHVSPTPHGDVFVHLEWLSPPGGDLATQTNGNSGIKLMSRYEVQIMNSPGIADVDRRETKFNEAGSIYRMRAPNANPSYGAGVWQTYDIWFRAPRWEGTRKVENARVWVRWNGVMVHDGVEVQDKTGMSTPESPELLPLLLQDHATAADGGVRYRNVFWLKDPWLKNFPPTGSGR